MALLLHHEHPWDLNPRDAFQLQEKLKREVITQPIPKQIELVGGLDVSYRGNRALAAFTRTASSGTQIDK